MKISYLLLAFICFEKCATVLAQDSTILVALTKGGKISERLPVLDSLHPFKASPMQLSGIRRIFGLTKQDIFEIRAKLKETKGVKLFHSEMPRAQFIPSGPFYRASQTGDSSGISFIEKRRPFYDISVPIIFCHSRKALIDIDLIGSGGYTYLLTKKNGQWVVWKELVRWVV